MKWMLGVWLALSAWAAESVDLSGAWKWHEGDDLRYAKPDFDDSSWSTRTLPRGAVHLGHSWYRRRGFAPASPGDYSLVLGTFSHCFEVFLNGVRLGGTACEASGEPPFPRAEAYRVPPGLVPAGSAFVVALRAEGRRVSFTTTSRLPDWGPYLLVDSASAPLLVELARLRTEKAAVPFGWFVCLYLGTALLLFGQWLVNRDRLEFLWLGGFAFLLSLYWSAASSLVYTGGLFIPAAPWLLPGATVCFGCAAYTVLHRRNPSPAVAAGLVAVVASCVLWLPRPYYQVVAYLPPAWWALRRFSDGSATHRAYAVAVIAYAAANFNSVAVQLWPGTWPIPTAFLLGPFLVTVPPLTSAVLSLIMLVLLLATLANERRDRVRLSIELESARTVQRSLLPPPQIQGVFSVDAAFEPAREVGGDFYQIAELAGGGCLVVVGDVSGKGLEAAMVASVAVGAFRSAATASPAAILTIMNRALAGQRRQGFVTCICARFDPDGHIVTANAGHPAPYRDGDELPVSSGLPLGVSPEAEYSENENQAGRQVTFISDGVVEAENAQRELFGFDRTRELSTKPAQEIAEAAKTWGQNDDITVVTVRRKNG